MFSSAGFRAVIAILVSHFAVGLLSLFGLGLLFGWLGRVVVGIVIGLVVLNAITPKEERSGLLGGKKTDV